MFSKTSGSDGKMLRRVVQRVFVGTHTTAQSIGMEGAMSSKDYDSFVRKGNRHVARHS